MIKAAKAKVYSTEVRPAGVLLYHLSSALNSWESNACNGLRM